MRTNNLLRALTALFSVLTIAVALPSGAAARQHQAPSAQGLSTQMLQSGRTASFTPATITGTTYYVSPTGSDLNSGLSPSQAWHTVQRATKGSVNLKPGDGILFQGGATYGDDVLMPGWGGGLAGTASAPIVFGSYGSGKASLPQGVWLHLNSYITIQDLDLGPAQGISGTSDNITVQGCSIHDIMPGQAAAEEVAINAIGSNWLIRGNTINHTGDSGMLIRGDHFQIIGNVITNTGQDKNVTYGAHGIYLKATYSTVTWNTISNFQNDGVSIRYRNSWVSNNTISDGPIGLGWFQYDTVAGTSHWTNNTIASSTLTAVYVSPSDPVGGSTRESFVITGNTIRKPSPVSSWMSMNLKPTSGTYTLSNNTVS